MIINGNIYKKTLAFTINQYPIPIGKRYYEHG